MASLIDERFMDAVLSRLKKVDEAIEKRKKLDSGKATTSTPSQASVAAQSQDGAKQKTQMGAGRGKGAGKAAGSAAAAASHQ